jgi:two-component system, LytTR family, sensor kinase
MPDAMARETEESNRVSGRDMKQIAVGALLFVGGTALGVFLVSLPVRGRIGGLPGSFLNLLGLGSLTWYACLLSSPLYVWLARRCPIDRRRWPRNLTIHLLITAALVSITGFIYYQWLRTAVPPGARIPGFRTFLMYRFFTESLPFWAMIALIHAYEFQRRFRQKELEKAQLETQLARTRLEALTAQLHPHFLFNTLQGISTLMHRDVNAADAMLSRLGDLLRRTLQRSDRHETSLSEELEVLNEYVQISKERFKDRLVFETDIPPDVHRALVPFFILQPLVENALQHGIERRAGIGRVRIRAMRQGERLHLDVTDDGPGLDLEATREGIGLANTRERLKALYGSRQSLTLQNPSCGGMRVELVIPYQEAQT